MPIPVAAWVSNTFPTSKSLNLACYTSDGTGDNPTGIAFHALRPILFESYGTASTIHANTSGSQSSLATSGTVTAGMVFYDTAGYFGQAADQPAGTGYYQFTPVIKGSAGDGINPGGWTLLSHFAAVLHKSTQTSLSADLLGTNQTPVSGTRQAPCASIDSTAFFLDLVNAAPTVTWSPAVTVADSSSTSTALVVNTADSSGETCRFYSVWAAVSATTAGEAVFNQAGTYSFPAPAGVTSVTAANTGSGAGGGAGNTGAAERGGGGGGGGEEASGSVAVTPGSNYVVTVGAGGTASNPGNSSVFAGDVASVTAHGGSAGGNATTSANGTGGAGGTGSTAATHHNGGAGASGSSAKFGGGGGSSAGTSAAGATATGSAGAQAPAGGGPGGAGGAEMIQVVQSQRGHANGSNKVTITMGSAFQAGNTVIVFLYYQGRSPTAQPTVRLSDQTLLSEQASADIAVTGLAHLQAGLYDTYNVTGGQTGVSIVAHGSDPTVTGVLAEVIEVAGLGPSPQIDVNSSNTQGPAGANQFYTNNPGAGVPTTSAPELWVGMTGAQAGSSFNINLPVASQGWTIGTPRYLTNGGITGGMLHGYQVRTATGSLAFSGTFSRGVTKATFGLSYETSAATAGNPPVVGPGGGGGGGLGAGNSGGAGADGQVTLTWTSISGGGYGTPPSPVPFSNWSDTTTVGTDGTTTVNLNGSNGPGGVLNFLSNAPVFRISQTAATSISTSTLTQVPFTGITPAVDNYSGWSAGTYTVQRDGLYLFHGLVSFANASSGARAALLTVNGTSYWGPAVPAPSVGTSNVAKTILLGLHAGDTVQLSCYQTRGSSLALDTTSQTRFLLAWMCELGAPAATWSPPDTTFRWQAGTKPTTDGGNLTQLFQTHLGNDLGFLVNRPYLTAWQGTAQTGISNGTPTTVTLDTVEGLIHTGDTGDNYTGWTSGGSNLYTAQVAGWYLTCFEYFTGPGPSADAATCAAALLPSTSGGVTPSQTPDYYQAQTVTTSASFGGGAAGFGLQYLSVGETVTPQLLGQSFSGTFSTLAGTVLGAQRNSTLGLVWISE